MLISDWSSDVCSSDLAVQSLPPPKLSVLFFTSPDPVTIVRPVAGLISLIPAATRFFLPPRPPNALNSAPPIGTFDTMLLAAPERTSLSTAADLSISIHFWTSSQSPTPDRKSVLQGKSVSVQVDYGGRRN